MWFRLGGDRESARRVVKIAASLFAASMMSTPSAVASDGEPHSVAVIPDGSVLATPGEVIEMGGTASDALVQQDIWDSLDPKVRHEQAARNEEERELAEAAFDNIVQPPRTVPRISPQTCGGANYYKYYKITSNTQATQCFAGAAGTYTPTTQIVDNGGTTNVRLQAAAYRGRVYYSLGNGHFWSETRGPGDYSWRSFGIAYDQRFVAKRVQLY